MHVSTSCKTTNTQHSLKTQPKLEGKGPSYLKGGKNNRIEKEFISLCKEKLKDDIDLQCELDYERSQDDFFVPNRKAKHRVPKTISNSNPQQKEVKNKRKREKRKQVKNQMKMKFKLT